MKKQYLFVAENEFADIEKWMDGDSKKTASEAFWASLTDSEKNATESVECVDERAA